MGDSKIEWCDAVWNPVRGCALVSPGCQNCYAMKQAHRFSGPGGNYEALTKLRKHGGPVWTGQARFIPEQLNVPLAWKRSRRIFVNSMSDLFHEDVLDEQLDQVLAVMLLAPHHIFQVLTKRPERMRAYLSDEGLYDRVLDVANTLRARRPGLSRVAISNPTIHPARWIWWGVSVEDQRYADERIPELLATPAAVRWVSYEPALGPVDFAGHWQCPNCAVSELGHADDGTPWCTHCDSEMGLRPWLGDEGGLDWVIVGGESGPGARPFDVAWAREAVRQTRDAGVACFVKQLGARPYDSNVNASEYEDSTCVLPDAAFTDPPEGIRGAAAAGLRLKSAKGGDLEEWPHDIRVREWPEVRA